MKKTGMFKWVVAGALSAVLSPALAQNTWNATWNWASGPGSCDPTTCTVTGASGNVQASISAWGATQLNSTFTGAAFNSSSNYLGILSGGEIGGNDSSPHHAIDNVTSGSTGAWGGKAEVLAIDFSQAVDLSRVAVSWTHSDSDAQIWRWDGGAAPGSLSSIKPNDLSGGLSGWTMVKAGQFSTSGNKLDIPGSVFSSHWLVSTALGGGGDGYNDAFKISTFTGDICKYTLNGGVCKPPGDGGGKVPEPTSLALVSLAIFGALGVRRRKAGRAA